MKIRMKCGIGYEGAEHVDEVEIPDSELEGKDELEKENYIYKEYLRPFAEEYLDMGYEEIRIQKRREIQI